MPFHRQSGDPGHGDAMEKSPTYGGSPQDGACVCRPGSFMHFAHGLANLVCPNCFTTMQPESQGE